MPRTKMGKKKSSIAKRSVTSSTQSSNSSAETSSGVSEALQALMQQKYETEQELVDATNAYFDTARAKFQEQLKNDIEAVKTETKRYLDSLPENVQNSNIKQGTAKLLRRSRSSEEVQSVFKKPETPPKEPKRTSRQRSRSATPASRGAFKTPTTFRRLVAGSTITPKVYNDAPITMMRRPMQGEMAVSVTGSPLMVSAVTSEEVPTINVPLLDGRVFSIMPEAGDAPFDLPHLDELTIQQLKTLREHLLKLAPDSP